MQTSAENNSEKFQQMMKWGFVASSGNGNDSEMDNNGDVIDEKDWTMDGKMFSLLKGRESRGNFKIWGQWLREHKRWR